MWNKSIATAIAVMVLGGVATLSYLTGSYRATQSLETGEGERQIAYWVAPMDPNFKSDKPGKSPMGMDLIPVYADEEAEAGVVTVSSVTQNNIGVRLGAVRKASISREIKSVGFVDHDETKLSHVHMRAEGWIDKLVTNTLGAAVQKGDLLFRIYAPRLVVAQSDYVQALGRGEQKYIATAAEQLALLGFNSQQIETLRRSRKVEQLVDVFAAQDGVITELNVAENMYVTPSTSILTIADLSTVWIMADVFENQAAVLSEGLEARIDLSYGEGQALFGTIDYVYPVVDPKTHTVKVRLKFGNVSGVLKPNMFVDVTIFGAPVEDALVIPKDALIRTGSSSRVIVALGEGKFEPREVKIGTVTAETVQITDGLREGEQIVFSGQFLIDSEASLSAGFQRMGPGVSEAKDMTMDIAEEKAEGLANGEPDSATAGEPVTGSGTVNSVMAAHHMVNLTHDPIPAIGWPTMTMDFKVSEAIDLTAFAQGDAVHFELGKGEDGIFFISALHKLDAMKMEGH
ncbi:MAG: efflux RND transporter periplasmic adaptor subunit [Alphaproteobacteria bacterium]|nr:MAG: efflux RND transporter periplasmic adaptor subunit [Alphaproteobacteria bacterium]